MIARTRKAPPPKACALRWPPALWRHTDWIQLLPFMSPGRAGLALAFYTDGQASYAPTLDVATGKRIVNELTDQALRRCHPGNRSAVRANHVQEGAVRRR
ncbi:MAG: hypothetical protein ACLSVD_05965 [Eggerthellaceae bacterium]